MQNRRLHLAIVFLVLPLAACTTVKTEQQLPDQALDAPHATDRHRVVFYNDTIVVLFPTSNRIGIKLDGKGVAAPYSGRYVQIDVPSGEHTLELSHFDVLYFHDKYPLKIEDRDVYLRVYCTPVATKFEQSREMPSVLPKNFKPIPP
jgi:hypothetical protein